MKVKVKNIFKTPPLPLKQNTVKGLIKRLHKLPFLKHTCISICPRQSKDKIVYGIHIFKLIPVE